MFCWLVATVLSLGLGSKLEGLVFRVPCCRSHFQASKHHFPIQQSYGPTGYTFTPHPTTMQPGSAGIVGFFLVCFTQQWLGVCFQIVFMVIPYFGKWSNLTSIFFFRWVETTNELRCFLTQSWSKIKSCLNCRISRHKKIGISSWLGLFHPNVSYSFTRGL